MSGIREYKSEIKVDITIVCYNHERTIEKCLKGVTSQVGIEIGKIIIHDDASTDQSPQIIQRYCENFKTKFSFIQIIQRKNTYQFDSLLPGKTVLSHATSDYVAILDGDDVWIDEHKLQKQVEAIKKTKTCLAFSSAEFVTTNGEVSIRPTRLFRSASFLSCIMSGGSNIPTSSIVLKRDLLNRFTDEFWRDSNFFDLPLKLVGTSEGAVFIPSITTRIEKNQFGSFSYIKNRKSKAVIIAETKERLSDVLVVAKLLKPSHKYIFAILLSLRIFLATLKAILK